MPQTFSPKLLTANHLQRGDAIYWAASGWTDIPATALLFDTEASAAQALQQANAQAHIAVGPYLADAALAADGTPYPTHFREAFRTRGPSNYAHGKQEQADV